MQISFILLISPLFADEPHFVPLLAVYKDITKKSCHADEGKTKTTHWRISGDGAVHNHCVAPALRSSLAMVLREGQGVYKVRFSAY